MKKSRFIETQIIRALKKNNQGRSVGNFSRELDVDESMFYNGSVYEK